MIKQPSRQQSKTTPEPQLPDPNDAGDGHEVRMTLFDHLNELRVRVQWAFFAIVIGTLIGFVFAGSVVEFLRVPYCEVIDPGESCQLLIIDPTGGIVVYLRVALLVGGILAIPIVTYQVMMFVVPGLTRKETRIVLFSIPPIFILFLIGVTFSWLVLMPPALGFLEGFQPVLFKTDWTADLYLSFVTSLIFWMGVAFETPLVFFVLSVLGVVTPGSMARNWRVAVIGAAVAAALITPTIDPVNMALVMGPLLALYTLSIVLSFFGARLNRPTDESVPA